MTEIILVDGRMRKIASAYELLERAVLPGIYKIRSRKGSVHKDKLVEITGEREHQSVSAPEIMTRSSAPLYGTETNFETHSLKAQQLSQTTHLDKGAGSSLFIYIRDQELSLESNPPPWDLPPSSVSLHSLDGEFACNLEHGEVDTLAGWCGITVSLDPGTWRLRVETEPMGTYEFFVTTVANWQTQVFFALDNFSIKRQTIRRPSLRDAVVMMARLDQAFNPSRRDLHEVSLAREALSLDRAVTKEDIKYLLQGKFIDPLMGIYGLHLLLLKKRRPKYNFEEILYRLNDLLGPNHPDLLALKLNIAPDQVDESLKFTQPPLLYHSWNFLLNASSENNSRIPGEGLLSQLAEDFVTVKPWLIHRVPKEERTTAQSETISLIHGEQLLKTLIESNTSSPNELRSLIESHKSKLSSLQLRVLISIIDQNIGESSQDRSKLARHLFSNLNAPGYSIANAVGRIVQSLESEKSKENQS